MKYAQRISRICVLCAYYSCVEYTHGVCVAPKNTPHTTQQIKQLVPVPQNIMRTKDAERHG